MVRRVGHVAFTPGALLLSVALAAAAPAMPPCEKGDVEELCQLARDARNDNSELGQPGGVLIKEEEVRAERNAGRRERARTILYGLTNPTWHDLWNAGYVLSYGDAPQDQLLTLAIGIRVLSLAPNDTFARALVAMTVDDLGRAYVGAQLYGRKKFIKMNPATFEVEFACLPQMLDPPLPASVGVAFDAPRRTFPPCPKGVGEQTLGQPIVGADR